MPLERDAMRRCTATILSRIFETVQRRTIILKKEGDSYEGYPGLSRTTPFGPFNAAGWLSVERIWRRIEWLIAFTGFQVR